MTEDEQLIKEFGIESWEPEKQQRVLDELRMQIGEAIAKELSDEQLAEYQAIIDGDQAVIDRWLSENAPDYESTIAYQELSEGFDEDPDKVPADKVFASIAWVQKNHPGLQQTVDGVKQQIKANLDQYAAE